MRTRRSIPILVAAASLLLSIGDRPGYTQTKAVRPSLARLDDFAGTITDPDETAIRTLTDSIVGVSLFASAPAAVRDRLFRAELSFRRKQSDGVMESNLVDSINTFASSVAFPNFYATSADQVRLLRLKLISLFPHLLAVPNLSGPPRTSAVQFGKISPTGALFLADVLLRQKLLNSQYQVAATEWLRQEQHRTIDRSHMPSASPVVHSALSASVSALLANLDHDLPDPNSSASAALNIFLTRLGL